MSSTGAELVGAASSTVLSVNSRHGSNRAAPTTRPTRPAAARSRSSASWVIRVSQVPEPLRFDVRRAWSRKPCDTRVRDTNGDRCVERARSHGAAGRVRHRRRRADPSARDRGRGGAAAHLRRQPRAGGRRPAVGARDGADADRHRLRPGPAADGPPGPEHRRTSAGPATPSGRAPRPSGRCCRRACCAADRAAAQEGARPEPARRRLGGALFDVDRDRLRARVPRRHRHGRGPGRGGRGLRRRSRAPRSTRSAAW